jgi:hypothetical protein
MERHTYNADMCDEGLSAQSAPLRVSTDERRYSSGARGTLG